MTSVGSNIQLLKDVGNSRYASEDSRTKRSVHELIPFGNFVVKICFRSSWTYTYCLWLLGYFFTQKLFNLWVLPKSNEHIDYKNETFTEAR
jgi:hypothetical protein